MVAQATYDRKTTPQAEDAEALFVGLNSRLEPDKLPPGYAAAAVNVRMRNGQCEPRKGVVKLGWLNVTQSGADSTIQPVGQFYGAGEFQDPDSVEWSFTAADGQIFRHRPHNARFALPLPTGVRILSRVTFTQAFNKMYCFRGRHLAPLVMPDIDTGFMDVVAHYSAATAYDAAIVSTGQVADEIAYGPFQAITSLTSVADLATCVTTLAHGFVTGADVTIQGATETGYNGRWNITVIDEVTFTFLFAGASASPATGTPKVSNMGDYWKALGSKVTLTSLTSSTTTATATKAAHGFVTGQYVTIAGADQAAYNGTYQITVTDADHFTFTFAGSGTSPATGTITAQSSVVRAGQSPDTNPEAWQQLFNILPNADDALYINNRLLVPTAYTPGATDYDSSSSYTKKDFIVATDILDDVHFDFQNEFRINQGSDDEIITLVKYAADTAIVVKGKSWGVLSNIGIDLSNLALDMHTDGYGGCAPTVVVAGKDVLFPATQRGIVSIVQNELGKLRSVDIPFSNDITKEVARINWNYADKIRLAYWDDKLYCAVPLDSSTFNNAIMVYDYRAGDSGAWQCVDEGEAICPMEFFKATYNGLQRLCFIASDGFADMVEEATSGDHVRDTDTDTNLNYAPIATSVTSRGFRFDTEAHKNFKNVQVVLGVWDASYSVLAHTGAANSTRSFITDKTFSRFNYIRPFDKAPYGEGNANDDFATPGRGNYAVYLPDAGLSLGSGAVNCGQFQEITERVALSEVSQRYTQVLVTNGAGRCVVKSITPIASEGQRRGGTII
jgi:hypothetical protein